MNGKYYNNPTFPEAEEEKGAEEVNTNNKRVCKVFASFPSETWKDKMFEGIIKDNTNDLIKILTNDNRTVIIPCSYIDYIEIYSK